MKIQLTGEQMLIGYFSPLWLVATFIVFSCMSSTLVSQEVTKRTETSKHYYNWKGEKVAHPQPAADGFYRDSNDRIRLARREIKKTSLLGFSEAERHKVEQGILANNRGLIFRPIDDLKLNGLDKVYLKSEFDEVVVSVVVSDEDASDAIIIAAMSTLLPFLKDSDVNKATIYAYLGESWVDAEEQKFSPGVMKVRKRGPIVAMARFKTFPRGKRIANKESDSFEPDTESPQAGVTEDQLIDKD